MSAESVRTAIAQLSERLVADPSAARARNAPATARIAKDLRFEVTGPHGERVDTDMPRAMGGAASAPNPGWLLRGALASCLATVIAMRAATLGVALSALEVTVESDSDARGILGLDDAVSAGLDTLRTMVRIGAPDASADTLREIVEWAEAHAPIGCTLRRSPDAALRVDIV